MGTEPLLNIESPSPRRRARHRHFSLQHLVIAVLATVFSCYIFNHIRRYILFRRHSLILDASLGPEDIWDSVSRLLYH